MVGPKKQYIEVGTGIFGSQREVCRRFGEEPGGGGQC